MRLVALAAAALAFAGTAGAAESVKKTTAAPTPIAPTPRVEPPPPTPVPQMKVITLDGAAMTRPLPRAPLAAADVPVDQVLRISVNKSQPIDLPAAVKEIVVGNPEIADVMVRAPSQVFVITRALGDTNIFLLDAQGRLLRRLEVHVHADTESLKAVLKDLFPDEQIDVYPLGTAISLSGTVSSDRVAQHVRAVARRFVTADEYLVNLLRVAGESQVLLRVRLAEMAKNVLKEMDGEVSYGAEQVGNTFVGSLGTATNGWASIDNPAFAGGQDLETRRGEITIGHRFFPLAISIEALEDEGLVKTLAEPTLVTTSGEEARVLSGSRIPIGSREDTAGNIVILYENVGVQLTFVPVVSSPGRINLKMFTEVSAITGVGAFNSPIIGARRAATSVDMPSGGSMMIAGVLTHDQISGLAGVPGLMDMPVLGTLFRSSSFEKRETELVITVEAYIVQPTTPKKIALPTDGFVPSSDLDRYFLGRLNKVYGKPGAALPGEVPQGPIGYIVQ